MIEFSRPLLRLRAARWIRFALPVAALALAHPGESEAFKLGVNTGHAASEPMLRSMTGAGLGNVRLPVYWRDVEPERRGVRTWSKADAQVAAAARAGATLEVVLAGAPAWAISDIAMSARGACDTLPVAGVPAFADFAGAMAERYGSNGSFWTANPALPKVAVRTWQVWNEPNIPCFAGAAWTDARRYATLLAAASDRIRAADRGTRVLPAGVAMGGQGKHDPSGYIRSLWSKLGKTRARGLPWAVHVYKSSAKQVADGVMAFRKLIDSLGCAGCSLVLAEFGWGAGKSSAACIRCAGSEQQQTAVARDLLTRLKASEARTRLSDVRWFQWGDSASPQIPLDGLVRPDGTARPVLGLLTDFVMSREAGKPTGS